jgi:hypothetical protein
MKLLDLKSIITGNRRLALAAVAAVSVLAMGLTVVIVPTFPNILNFKSSGGSLAAYLVGGVHAQNHSCWGTACIGNSLPGSDSADIAIRLVNPTNTSLKAYIAVYNAGNFLACKTKTLGRNNYAQVYLRDDMGEGFTDSIDTIKVVSVNAQTPTSVLAGLKGWLTHFQAETLESNGTRNFVHMRETEMQEVPIEIARAGGEASKIISDSVNHGCP